MSSKSANLLATATMLSVVVQAALVDGTILARITATILVGAAFFCGMTIGFNFPVAKKEVQ